MGEILRFFTWLGDVWGYLVAFSAVGMAGYKLTGRFCLQVYRIWCFSNCLHLHFGPDAAAKIIAKIYRHSRDITILAAQQELVEMDLDLAVFLCDASGEYSCVNSRFAHLFGLDREECEGRGWLECILPSERERVHKTWTYATQQKLAYDCHVTVQNRSTGQQQRCILQAKPWFAEGLTPSPTNDEVPDMVAVGEEKPGLRVAFYLGTVRRVTAAKPQKEPTDVADGE